MQGVGRATFPRFFNELAKRNSTDYVCLKNMQVKPDYSLDWRELV